MKLPLFTLLGLILASSLAHATGGAGVRGGGIAVWSEGRWALKEVFESEHPRGDIFKLSSDMRQVISRQIRPLVELYTGTSRGKLWDLILDETVDFRLVNADEDLYNVCGVESGEKLADSESNYGCTKNGITYLIRSRFEAFDNLSKLLALLHQRGHALDPRGHAAHEWIEPFVAGVNLLLKTIIRQENNEWRKLTAPEYTLVQNLMRNPRILEWLSADGNFDQKTSRLLVQQGGGIVLTSAPYKESEIKIDATSYLGVGSVLDLTEETCGAISNLSAFAWVGDSTQVRGSTVACALLRRSKVFASDLLRTPPPPEAERVTPWPSVIMDSTIERSFYSAHYGYALDQTTIRDSEIVYIGPYNGRMNRCVWENVLYKSHGEVFDFKGSTYVFPVKTELPVTIGAF